MQGSRTPGRRDARAARERRAQMLDGQPNGGMAANGSQSAKKEPANHAAQKAASTNSPRNTSDKAKTQEQERRSKTKPKATKSEGRPDSTTQPRRTSERPGKEQSESEDNRTLPHIENVPASEKPKSKMSLVKRSRVVYESDWAEVKRRYIPSHIRAGIFYAICIAILVFASIALGQYIYDTMHAQGEFQEVVETYVEPDPIPVEEQDDTSAWPPIVDFAALQAENPDVAGWIRIPGTTVDYPILTNEENDYYLRRNMSGAYSIAGAIFADYQNAPDLLDNHLVIYGHHMQTPTMFHDVARYSNRDFFDAHRVIYIETPETTYVCRPVGMYTAPQTEYEARKVIFDGAQDYQGYFDDRMARRDYIAFDDYERSTADRLITLITCNNTGSERQFVECVVEQEYPTSMIPQVIATALAEKKASEAAG